MDNLYTKCGQNWAPFGQPTYLPLLSNYTLNGPKRNISSSLYMKRKSHPSVPFATTQPNLITRPANNQVLTNLNTYYHVTK